MFMDQNQEPLELMVPFFGANPKQKLEITLLL